MKKEPTRIEVEEDELIAKLQNNLGLSEQVAGTIVYALGDYITAIAENRAQDALDRKFNEGAYR